MTPDVSPCARPGSRFLKYRRFAPLSCRAITRLWLIVGAVGGSHVAHPAIQQRTADLLCRRLSSPMGPAPIERLRSPGKDCLACLATWNDRPIPPIAPVRHVGSRQVVVAIAQVILPLAPESQRSKHRSCDAGRFQQMATFEPQFVQPFPQRRVAQLQDDPCKNESAESQPHTATLSPCAGLRNAFWQTACTRLRHTLGRAQAESPQLDELSVERTMVRRGDVYCAPLRK
jgi:hypothetical protein